MASNIKYPENDAMYFIEGDALALVTKVDSSGSGRTTARKQFKAIAEAVTDGILIHYYAEPNTVTAITDNVMQASMAMATKHERNFKEAIQRYGVRKKDKTGGSRVVKVPNLV